MCCSDGKPKTEEARVSICMVNVVVWCMPFSPENFLFI